jgi:hypothetical protein
VKTINEDSIRIPQTSRPFLEQRTNLEKSTHGFRGDLQSVEKEVRQCLWHQGPEVIGMSETYNRDKKINEPEFGGEVRRPHPRKKKVKTLWIVEQKARQDRNRRPCHPLKP